MSRWSTKLARAPLCAIVPALIVAALLVAGCGKAGYESEGSEGHFIEVGDALYQVQLSRLLTQSQRPDDN